MKDLKILCDDLGVSEDDILRKDKTAEILVHRQSIAYFLRKRRGYKLAVIASMLKRHHTTIMHEIKVFEGLLQVKDTLAVSVWEKIDKICD